MQAAAGQEAPMDPAAARKAEDEAEERRLAEIRSHGTMVTPQTFAEWKQRFDAETALQRSRLQGKLASRLPSAAVHLCSCCHLHIRQQSRQCRHQGADEGHGSRACMLLLVLTTGGMHAQGARLQGTRRTKGLQGSTSSDRWRPMLLSRYFCLLKGHFVSPLRLVVALPRRKMATRSADSAVSTVSHVLTASTHLLSK